jgi:hypothetical protein
MRIQTLAETLHIAIIMLCKKFDIFEFFKYMQSISDSDKGVVKMGTQINQTHQKI